MIDAAGRYTIRYDPIPGVTSVNLRVEVSDEAGKLLQSSAIIPQATSLEIMNLVIPGTDGEVFQVAGKVASRSRAGVDGLRVRIADRVVGGDILLAEVLTSDGGEYRVSFTDAESRRRGKAQPDLQARVFTGETYLASSDVHYNASNRETINILLDDQAASALQSEHETLTSALSVHFIGALADLKETDEQQDITYLANKTGWDARAVALAALADQFSRRATGVDIPPVFFYALFRAGLPANEDTLYHTDARTLTSAWNIAAEQGVIANAMTPMIPQMVERFRTVSAQKLLTAPALAGASPLKEMLSASRLNDAQQKQFAELYAANRTDLPKFWNAVTNAFGQNVSNRLQVDGKLGFLTINNAPLMQALHTAAGGNGVSDPLQLAQLGYHSPNKWDALLTSATPIPKEIPGDTAEARRANYAEYLAAQVRLSYPTASVAQMVKSGELPLTGAAQGASDQVHAFLTQHQGKFEIGVQPVQQYIAQNQLQIADQTVQQVKRLQRVYQITPSDQAMKGLMKHGLDAAFHITRHEKNAFVETYQEDLGGPEIAARTYDKSVQIYNAVLNVTMSYLTAKNGIQIGAPALKAAENGSENAGQIITPVPKPPSNTSDVIAYGTLENLFGSMDFCACDHCRSILSPAAYLVDLLQFVDHAGAGGITAPIENPQTVLFDRRPDIQHLPLTCENTNTVMPYIDVVNETLEYFIANNVQQLSLKGYLGHDTNGVASEDLLSSPQYAIDAAYTTLQNEYFPSPLPFHRPLENLRRYFDKFEAPLPLAMERLRKNDSLERGTNPYGWRDILMEEIGLSRPEYEILTNSNSVPLWRMYGFPNGMAESNIVSTLSNVKQFTRRVGITYEEIVAILKTRFVNPSSDLIPKLERLGVSFAVLKAFKEGTIDDAGFDNLLPKGAGAPDPKAYDGNIKAWVKNQANFDRIMGLITLTNVTDNEGAYDFGDFELRHAKPMINEADTSTRLSSVEFTRLLRFIRLWKKTGWTIEQTDAAICALYRTDLQPLTPGDIDTAAKLDAGFFNNLLPRLGIVVRVMKALNLTPERDLLLLLACWSEIGTHGDCALYRQMFLNPTILKQDAVFDDNGYGEFLVDGGKMLVDHAEALRSAFNLTGDEYGRIIAELKYDGNTKLNLPNISAIYRRGYLARKLHLSVREFLLLTSLTGLNPFAQPNLTNPAIAQLIALTQALKDRSINSADALYLIWNQDLSGKSATEPAQMMEFARILRGDFAEIEEQFAVIEDAGGDVARARMALAYGQEVSGAFFALLDNTQIFDVAYTHPASALEAAITAADSRIAYDNFRHRLSYLGVLTAARRDVLKSMPGVTTEFQDAVNRLFARSEDFKGSFFGRYPELKPLYDTYIASADPPATKRSALAAAFRPALARQRKRQQALQRLSAAARTDLISAQTLLDPPGGQFPLHAAGRVNQPALNDVIALETEGLAAQFFFEGTTDNPSLSVPAVANLDYASGGNNPLPANPTPGAPVSGIWSGKIETPEAGFYNFIIETDAGTTDEMLVGVQTLNAQIVAPPPTGTAIVNLAVGGQTLSLTKNGNIYRNTTPLELKAGTLYNFELKVEKLKYRLSVKWETPKRAREVIPSRYLYPPAIFAPFFDLYSSFLKATSLAAGLGLTTNEIAHLAIDSDYLILNDGWLNALPASGDPDANIATALLKPLMGLLDYARIKAEISPGDESLLTILQDPVAATAKAESLFFTQIQCASSSLNAVLAHFSGNIAGLKHFDQFRRVYDALSLIRKMGISASALIKATTNEPTGVVAHDFLSALRARFDAADWRDLVRPINDAMRGLQRDALVAYILHLMRSNPASEHIDTPEKLFEYFLMDVQMEPSMQTSRIRHALSSAQLFIERCLMNLEPRVRPNRLNAGQWEWMKRYRVWEANRKVFLYPENWLEPELRDDKSPFFKEIESELLQSDITEEAATGAVLNYLSKLDEVAKLEPCGIHHIPADLAERTSEIDHVIARTSGANRKYYYRRREDSYWTPWEQINLDIEDNPVMPYVWNGRLLLFWLRIIKQAPIDPNGLSTSSTKTGKITEYSLSELKSDAQAGAKVNTKMTVQAVLCWSEYYNGKWQPTKTSDVNRPTHLGSYDAAGAGAFNRTNYRLGFFEEPDALRVVIIGDSLSSFLLYNTHSVPLRQEDTTLGIYWALSIYSIYLSNPTRSISLENDSLNINYYSASDIDYPSYTYEVLSGKNNPLPGRVIATERWSAAEDRWFLPFFYEDSRHTFFVTTTVKEDTVSNYSGYGVTVNPDSRQVVGIPPLILQSDPRLQPGPAFWDERALIDSDPGVTAPAPMRQFVTEDAYIRRGIGTTGSVIYGDRQIVPSGAILNNKTRK
ncbi:MAG TPA: neuraminidase-like domain-containing protein [Blastocatellia bacterium]